jgi:4-oxalocrotonate tautomerase
MPGSDGDIRDRHFTSAVGVPSLIAIGTRLKRRHEMPVVTVLQGPRGADQKRKLVEGITAAFGDAYDLPAEAVQVWIHDTPTDSWGQGGKLRADG